MTFVTLANFVYSVYSLWFYYFQNTFWLSNLSILSVPEGYSRNTSFAKTLIITFLLDRTVFYINPIQNEHPIKTPGNVSLVKISSDTNLDSITYSTSSHGVIGQHRFRRLLCLGVIQGISALYQVNAPYGMHKI